MKIIFFGTPDFAVPSLDILHKHGYKISAVVTVTDKEQGRGLKPAFSPIKKYAMNKGLKLLQPEKLNDSKFQEELKKLNPDLGVVVAFKILPRDVYTIPKSGTFNLHASLLPKYRGAAPIQWALINGDICTGLTTFFLEDKVDTGNIIMQTKTEILPEDNFETLHDRMAHEGAKLVLNTVKAIEENRYDLIMQDSAFATPAPKITKEMCRINWAWQAFRINNLVRGLSPVPGSFTTLDKKQVKIYKVSITEFTANKIPGAIEILKDGILVNTADRKLLIDELQIEGKRRLTGKEFLKGFRAENSELIFK